MKKRSILFAPWRHTYIKRAVKAEEEEGDCAFCDALKVGQKFESLIVYNGKLATVILNKFPYNNGHTMVIPKRHTAEFEKLSVEEFEELHSLLRKSLEAIKAIYQPQGVNIGMNLGRSGGAGIVDHLHYHLVPRWSGDTNFMPIVAETKVISESLDETYKKMAAWFAENL